MPLDLNVGQNQVAWYIAWRRHEKIREPLLEAIRDFESKENLKLPEAGAPTFGLTRSSELYPVRLFGLEV